MFFVIVYRVANLSFFVHIYINKFLLEPQLGS
jgi:hypothetical protein